MPEAPVPEAEPPAEEEGGAPAGKVKRSLSLPRASSPPPLLPPKRVKSEQALSAGKAKAPGREPSSVQPSRTLFSRNNELELTKTVHRLENNLLGVLKYFALIVTLVVKFLL